MKIDSQSNFFNGLFLKLDQNGKVVLSKVFANNFDTGQVITLKYFQLDNIVEANSNIIMNGLVNKQLSAIGYSDDSFVDQIVLSLDEDGNTQWASVFDYNKVYDSDGSMAYYDSIIYSTSFGDYY